MRIIDGFNYYEKLENMIQECIIRAKESPFEDFIFIAEDKNMVEQLFLKHTHYLVNIQVMTWSSFLQYLRITLHLTKHHVMSCTEMMYQLYALFQDQTFACFHDVNFSLIEKFIPLMQDFNLFQTHYIQTASVKLNDFIHIYQSLLKNCNDYTHFTYEDIFKDINIQLPCHLYVEGDHLYQPLRQHILHQFKDVTILYTHGKDERIMNIPYHHLCEDAISDESKTFLTRSLFTQTNEKLIDNKHYTFIATTPLQEVTRVVYTIKQMIVDEGLRYQDFAIVYPDQSYVDILTQVLKDTPHNLDHVSYCIFSSSYRRLLKKIDGLKKCPISTIAMSLIDETLDKDYLHYLESLSTFDREMTAEEFKDFFQATCHLDKHNKRITQDVISIFSIEKLKLSSPKHIFILGMNETVLPHFYKDSSLLLNEDIELLRKQNISTPLNTLEQLAVHHNDIFKALQQPYHTITFSYPTSSLSGEVRLPSSLYKQLETLYQLQPLKPLDYLSLEDYYLSGGMIDTKNTLNQHIHDYIESQNQPQPIHPDVIEQLYSDTMSVSQIETYNKCPFLYFIQYGLGVYPVAEDKLLPNELGSLVHYVLAENINKDKNIEALVRDYIQEHEQLSQKIQSSALNQYFIEQLIKDLDMTIDVVNMYLNTSQFEVLAKEEKVEDNIQNIKFKGFVDRIDTYQNYLSIIDYKSSAKDIDLNLAMQGFNIQMLLYLKMATKHYQKDPSAVLYFNTKKRILSVDQALKEELDESDILSLYRYGGYVIDDDHTIINAIDPTIDKKSHIIHVNYVKSKDEYKGKILTTSQLNNLYEEIENHIQDLYQHMCQGDIGITPKGSNQSATHTLVNPCHFCPNKSICHFDVFYNDYKMVEFYDIDEKLGGKEDAI